MSDNEKKSESLFKKRLKKFKSLKRGYYSFLILLGLYATSFCLPVLMNSKALVVKYEGKYYYPVFGKNPLAKFFNQYDEYVSYGEAPPNYRLLKARFEIENKGNWVMLPPYPYDALETFATSNERVENKLIEGYKKGKLNNTVPTFGEEESSDSGDGYSGDEDDEGYAGDDDEGMDEGMGGSEDEGDSGYAGDEDGMDDEMDEGMDEGMGENDPEMGIADDLKKVSPPFGPSRAHWLGTDEVGRDLFARLAYGFNISITFALILCAFAYFVGLSVGATIGYFGGWVDMLGLRAVEIWQTVPFLFTVMILGDAMSDYLVYSPGVPNVLQPKFLLLVVIMAIFGWMSVAFYVRGEVLREKSRDYVSAAISIGTDDSVIIFKHLLPNSLTPIVTFAPFAIVGNISALVSLDYLGFGLPAPTPSWGELMQQATRNINTAPLSLILSPIAALFVTLLLVVFIGEAIREAFDPKVYSRLR